MVQMYKLCSEQLSLQDHYDFGMRAVKSVLVMAGTLKRASPDRNEDVVLICALRDSNLPKFLSDDAVLFQVNHLLLISLWNTIFFLGNTERSVSRRRTPCSRLRGFPNHHRRNAVGARAAGGRLHNKKSYSVARNYDCPMGRDVGGTDRWRKIGNSSRAY